MKTSIMRVAERFHDQMKRISDQTGISIVRLTNNPEIVSINIDAVHPEWKERQATMSVSPHGNVMFFDTHETIKLNPKRKKKND